MRINSEWITFQQYQQQLSSFSTDSITLYHSPLWLESLIKGFSVDIQAVLSTGEENKILAITPFIVMRKGPFLLFGSPLSGVYTEFVGPLFFSGLGKGERSEVLESQHRLVAKRGHYIEWGCKGENENVESWGKYLEQHGYEHIARPTLLLDLSLGEKKVWESFKGRARNMTRKAEKSGVVALDVIPTMEWINDYYEMLQETFGQQGRKVPHPLAFYKQIVGIASAGMARCVVAEIEGRMIAAAIFLIDKKRMLYLSGTATTEGKKLAATTLIQWHAIREAIATDITDYDMGGLGVSSIDKFKRSFGGQEIQHHRWIYRSRLFGIIEPIARWAAQKGLIKIQGG